MLLIKTLCGLFLLADFAYSVRQPPLLICAFFLTGSALQTLLHECGHFVGGLWSGYEFCCLSLGPLQVLRDSGGIRIWMRRGLSAHCQCVMIPPEDTSSFLRYNLGGIAANAAMCAVSATAAWRSGGMPALFWTQLFFSGLVKITANSIPCVRKGMPNDGLAVLILCRSPESFADYKEYLRLYRAAVTGHPVRSRRRAGQTPVHERDALDMIYYQGILGLEREYPVTQSPP